MKNNSNKLYLSGEFSRRVTCDIYLIVELVVECDIVSICTKILL